MFSTFLVFKFPDPHCVMGAAAILGLIHLEYDTVSTKVRNKMEARDKLASVLLMFALENHTVGTYVGTKWINIDTYWV